MAKYNFYYDKQLIALFPEGIQLKFNIDKVVS